MDGKGSAFARSACGVAPLRGGVFVPFLAEFVLVPADVNEVDRDVDDEDAADTEEIDVDVVVVVVSGSPTGPVEVEVEDVAGIVSDESVDESPMDGADVALVVEAEDNTGVLVESPVVVNDDTDDAAAAVVICGGIAVNVVVVAVVVVGTGSGIVGIIVGCDECADDSWDGISGTWCWDCCGCGCGCLDVSVVAWNIPAVVVPLPCLVAVIWCNSEASQFLQLTHLQCSPQRTPARKQTQ